MRRQYEGKEEKSGIFPKIESREDALRVIKNASVVIFIVVAIKAYVFYSVTPMLIIEVIPHVVLAGILLKWKSRASAVLLLLLGIAVIIAEAQRTLGFTFGLVTAIVLFWAAARAVEATFKLRGKFAEQSI